MKNAKAKTDSADLTVGLRRYLFFTAAMTGAAIMIVEILGAKMLAPYVGTSHFVWTAQIAVTLVALSVGYYVGGRLSDRSQRPTILYAAILAAAVYLTATILVVRPLAFWCLNFRLALGTLIASGVLFFIPLALLAMTGPFLARVISDSLQGVGGNIGRLTAVSTLGSFAGTLLIGYALIPLMANAVIMVITAGILVLVVVLYFLIWERRRNHLTGLISGLLAATLFSVIGVRVDAKAWTHGDGNVLFRGNSNFGMLQVVEDSTSSMRYYLNDYLVQNTYDVESKRSLSLFTYMLHDLAKAYAPQVESALCIGLGVGIVPMQFAQEGTDVEVVEINPAVVEVAKRYFDCEPERFKLHLGDARYVLNRIDRRFDVVILDAFLGDSSPAHLMTREAFEAIKRVLNPEGVLVINCFVDFREGKDFFGASLDLTLNSVFADVMIHSAGNGNVFFVASDRRPLTPFREPDWSEVHPAIVSAARRAFASRKFTAPDHGMVLTDGFNPVEFYDAANREEIRRRLAQSQR